MDACLRQAMFPQMMEHMPANADDAVAASLKLIDGSDVYVGIIGYRYGFVPEGHEKSITEMEYERATERGIPRLVFVMGDEHPVTAHDVETGPNAEKLVAFKQTLLSSHIVEFFRSADELRGLVIGALARVKEQFESERKEAAKPLPTRQRRLIRVFVASPSDVREERSRMPRVIDSLNRTLGRLLDVVIELWRWEVDAPPAAGEPQALIDPELDQSDVVVVIFWNRFGMPTTDRATGTEHEVLRSLERWNRAGIPQVMIYYCQRPAVLNRDELEQRGRVLDFREEIGPLALTVDYKEVPDFEWRVHDDLFATIANIST